MQWLHHTKTRRLGQLPGVSSIFMKEILSGPQRMPSLQVDTTWGSWCLLNHSAGAANVESCLGAISDQASQHCQYPQATAVAFPFLLPMMLRLMAFTSLLHVLETLGGDNPTCAWKLTWKYHPDKKGKCLDAPSSTEVAVNRDCDGPRSSQQRLTWAMVQIPGVKPFWLAVYATHDAVSRGLTRWHNWEGFNAGNYGPPGRAVDIGANLGFYSFALAKSGWNVTSFEPMPANRALFKASLCANPDVVERIDLHENGLGDANQHCYLVSPNNNIGDGYVSCGNDTNPGIPPEGAFQSRGEFDVNIFDEIKNDKFAQHKVEFVKIDVEGYECHVFRGANKLLAQKPRLIRTEMKGHIADCTPSEYAQMFLDASYKAKTDVKCQNEAGGLPTGRQTWDFWMCLPEMFDQKNFDHSEAVANAEGKAASISGTCDLTNHTQTTFSEAAGEIGKDHESSGSHTTQAEPDGARTRDSLLLILAVFTVFLSLIPAVFAMALLLSSTQAQKIYKAVRRASR